MARSVWKGPFFDGYLLKKVEKARDSGRNEVIKIWSRRSTVLPQFVGLTFGVYNGQQAHTGARVGRHDRPQVRRVRSDPRLLRPLGRPESEEGGVMGKAKRERVLKENEAQAVLHMVRISPRKLNLVAQLIRGKKVADGARRSRVFAQADRRQSVRKTLQSAIANAENNHQLDVDNLVVAEAHVGKALVMKRFNPRARGRVGRILKPFSNLTVVVREVEESA